MILRRGRRDRRARERWGDASWRCVSLDIEIDKSGVDEVAVHRALVTLEGDILAMSAWVMRKFLSDKEDAPSYVLLTRPRIIAAAFGVSTALPGNVSVCSTGQAIQCSGWRTRVQENLDEALEKLRAQVWSTTRRTPGVGGAEAVCREYWLGSFDDVLKRANKATRVWRVHVDS